MPKVPDQNIFVAIAAYREPELRRTIENCIAQATHPERLRFGVCLQYDLGGPPETQPDCLDGLDAAISMQALDWTESKGGCWARHLAQGLYAGESHTLQIDSHMRMAPGWDSLLLSMIDEFPGDKPLITGHCPLYDLVDGVEVLHGDGSVPVTIATDYCVAGWLAHPAIELADDKIVPRPTRVLSGGFVFTLGAWNVEVRQDPEHLYTGEELALTIRSFTWGYDLYNPSTVVAWHRHHPQGNYKYIFDGEPDDVQRRDQRAYRRLRLLHRGDPDRVLAPYSTGPVRTVDEYCAWSGLDYRSLSITEDARSGVAPRVFEPSW